MSQLRKWKPGIADAVFVFISLCVLLNARNRLLDDPSLGWNIEMGAQLWATGEFMTTETFSYASRGNECRCEAWLTDLALLACDRWAGLAGLAVFASLAIALALRILYRQLTQLGVHWLAALGWTFLAALGTTPAWVARPNVVTLPAIVFVAATSLAFHLGKCGRMRTLWLVPLFLVWPWMHGGFLAGAFLLVVTWLVELALSILGPSPSKSQARARLKWWTLLGLLVFAVTLLNPYGWRLYTWNLETVLDPYTQTQTTMEWHAPNFKALGWWRIELFVLLFPLLAMFSNRKPSVLAASQAIVWLHLALTTQRYSPLWVLIVTPTVATLALGIPAMAQACDRGLRRALPEIGPGLLRNRDQPTLLWTVIYSISLLAFTPLLGGIAAHNQSLMPSDSLDECLRRYDGGRVFHSLNWGGYLIWQGRKRDPDFQIWLDDHFPAHGRLRYEEHRQIMGAEPGWETQLDQYDVRWAWVPADSRLARALAASDNWNEVFDGEDVTAFRRSENPE